METSATFTMDEVGNRTGRHYEGKFVVKTILSRRDNFRADEIRRLILGSNPTGAAPALNGEAFMLGMLSVKILESPKWWSDSDSGQDLEDENIIVSLYKITGEKEAEREKEIQGKAKESLEKLAKSKKISSKDD